MGTEVHAEPLNLPITCILCICQHRFGTFCGLKDKYLVNSGIDVPERQVQVYVMAVNNHGHKSMINV